MLDSILTCYNYEGKSVATGIADFILSPTRIALGKEAITYEVDKNVFIHTKDKTEALYLRIIYGILAVLLVPISLLASTIKFLDSKNLNVHHACMDQEKESERREELLKKGAKKCAVCLDVIEDISKARFLTCMDSFHPECVDPWLKEHDTCPICRTVQRM